MSARYVCDNRRRLQVVRDETTLNAIDYLEVLDADAPADSPRQRTLLVRCLQPVAGLDGGNVVIEGGVRRTPVTVVWAHPADAVPQPPATSDEVTYLASLDDPDHVLVVRTDSYGDFSTYTLRLVADPADPSPPAGFDRRLVEVRFSFKVECPWEFDCRPDDACPPETPPEPALDYLAKDYASFRRLMLDRLSLLMPDWRERNAADQVVTVVELMAYLGDRLSYYQDAVATEAYLGTARKRISVRRHARLLDYAMHDGRNARAWVCLRVQAAGGADGLTLPAGSVLLAGHDAPPGGIDLDPPDVEAAVRAGARPFETLHDVTLRAEHNEIRLYTWGDSECCLPRGATGATLRGAFPDLAGGDVVIFEEVVSPTTGEAGDADPARRQAVRLTRVDVTDDPVGGQFDDPPTTDPAALTEIEWAPADALRFPVCVSARTGEAQGGLLLEDVSVVRGNVALADHGLGVEETFAVPLEGEFAPSLAAGPVTQQPRVRRDGQTVAVDDGAPAADALDVPPDRALPAIRLVEGDDEAHPWLPQRDLLGSGRFARELVVEVDDDGTATLRFGDGVHGRRPTPGTTLAARYRVGNGTDGNVGAGSIAHLVTPVGGVLEVWNPLPARGGAVPESLTQVRQFAPQAFRVPQRAVTEADYGEVSARRRDVQRARAAFRWTGSWHTAFVAPDRVGGDPDDPGFRGEIRDYLERFRMAGVDLAVRRPVFVPLLIEMTVCVEPGYFAPDVKRRLLEVFGRLEGAEGRHGFFHPDRWSFGDPVYLSQVYEAAMGVDGVSHVEVTALQRWDGSPGQALDTGVLEVAPHEIVRLDNDANFPENGKLALTMEGGL